MTKISVNNVAFLLLAIVGMGCMLQYWISLVSISNGHLKDSVGSNLASNSMDNVLRRLTIVEQDKDIFGIPLNSWERDTSREYYLSLKGKWNASAESHRTRFYRFVITNEWAAPDGVNKSMLLINGQFPGPLIECNTGDTIQVVVINNLNVSTTMHWHGMFQQGTNHMDGAHGINFCAIPPGESFTYKFDVKDQYGTYWYHAHYGLQYQDGLIGPLIVHSPIEDEILDYDEDVVLLLSDNYHDTGDNLLAIYKEPNMEKSSEPVPDSGLIQGKTRFNDSADASIPVIPVLPNKTYRLRLINCGAFSEFDFSIDSHRMSVVEADGTLTEPTHVDVVRLQTAQRYSVLIHTNQTDSSYWIRNEMNTYCYDYTNDNLDTDVRAVLSYPSFTRQLMVAGNLYSDSITLPNSSTTPESALAGNILCDQLDAKLLVPAIVNPAPPTADLLVFLDISFFIGAGQVTYAVFNQSSWSPVDDSTLYRVVNNRTQASDNSTFNPSWADDQMVVTIPESSVVDIVFYNYDDATHPFHLHGYRFWELATGSGAFSTDVYDTLNLTNPMQRDTTSVQSFDWTLVRFQANNTGVWPMHCHISFHLAVGLLMQFNIMPNNITQPNDEWMNFCAWAKNNAPTASS